MPLHVFFPCFGTKTVPFLECESCIRHGVTLVYTSTVRQALDIEKYLSLLLINGFVTLNVFSQENMKYFHVLDIRVCRTDNVSVTALPIYMLSFFFFVFMLSDFFRFDKRN